MGGTGKAVMDTYVDERDAGEGRGYYAGTQALWGDLKSIPEGVESISRLSEAFDRIGQ